MRWTLIQSKGTDPLALIGRAEQVDEVKAISSTYACQNCCGDFFQDAYVTPPSVTGPAGESVTLSAVELHSDCYGFTYPVEQSASWSSGNAAVATVSGGQVTLIEAGQTTITATWNSYTSVSGQCTQGGFLPGPIGSEPCCSTAVFFRSASATVAVKPHLSSISPARGLQGVAYGVTITGKGFRAPASVTVAGTGISVSEVTVGSTTELLATFTVSATATGGNHAVTVKAKGQTSDNSVNFFVQIPTKLRRDSISALQNEPGGCGATKTLEYTLLDQAGEVIAEDLTVDEALSNFTSNPSGLPPPTAKHALANAGHLVDRVGYEIPTCPPPFTISVTQKFTVTVGQTTYNLTTTNSVSYGRDASANRFVTVTNTVP